MARNSNWKELLEKIEAYKKETGAKTGEAVKHFNIPISSYYGFRQRAKIKAKKAKALPQVLEFQVPDKSPPKRVETKIALLLFTSSQLQAVLEGLWQ
jgi:hypothetical protein